jgi:hypothetical protein
MDAMSQSYEYPPMEPSNEATTDQLALAIEQGEAFQHAVDAMMEEADDGAERTVGGCIVGYAVGKAEGMYYRKGPRLEWMDPGDTNVHVEVIVRDSADGRFLPGLCVQATLIDAAGKEIGTELQPFIWHPWLYHYGRNWRVPGDGAYGLRIHIDPPEFSRHDEKNGKRYMEPVDVEFMGVKIKTGQR